MTDEQPMAENANADPAELARFSVLATDWWDPNGRMRSLHQINPLRLDFIDECAGVSPARRAWTSAAAAG